MDCSGVGNRELNVGGRRTAYEWNAANKTVTSNAESLCVCQVLVLLSNNHSMLALPVVVDKAMELA